MESPAEKSANIYPPVLYVCVYVVEVYISLVQVSVTQSTEGFPEPQEIKTLGVGDYFGEKALIRFGCFFIPLFSALV